MRAAAVPVLVLLLLPMIAQPVFAQEISVTQVLTAAPDSATYASLLNLANSTDSANLSYNVTWQPFFDDWPDAEGITVTPFVPPVIVQVNTTDVRAVQKIRFTDTDLMGGASVSWWRSPIGNMTTSASVRFKLFRVDSSSVSLANISVNGPVFDNPAQTVQVWNYTKAVVVESDSILRRLEVLPYNFTLLKAFTPLFANKDYYAWWRFTEPATHPVHLYYTLNDIGNDGLTDSIMQSDGNITRVAADLDQSVVLLRGMAHGVAGLTLTCAAQDVICPFGPMAPGPVFDLYMNLTYSDLVLGGPTYTYVNLVFPTFMSELGDVAVEEAFLNLTIHDSLGGSYNPPELAMQWDETQSMTVASGNLSSVPSLVGKTIVGIDYRWTMVDQSTLQFSPVATLYLTATAGEDEMIVNMQDVLGIGTRQQVRYLIFGYFSIDTFFYSNTELTIVLFPVEEPNTELGISQLFHELRGRMQAQNQAAVNCQPELIFAQLVLGPDKLRALLDANQCILGAIVNGAAWVFQTVFNAILGVAGIIGPILYAIGAWIWQAITFLINAVEWFLFWAVKLLNLFIVGIVFSLVYLAPTYVGRGFYEFVRRGYDIAVLREVMRAGWERVWPIIQLMLTLVIMVISAIAAVIPL